MYDISTNITAAPRTKGESTSNRRARKEETKRVISLVAERFPAAFVADKGAPHRPLKVGVHADLLATGLLTPREVRNALVVYTGRLQYQRAVAAGGARFDLGGNVAGEVTQDQIEHAVAAVACLDAKAIAKAEAVRKEKALRKAARQRWEAAQEIETTCHQGDDRPPKSAIQPKPAENASLSAVSASTSTPKASPPSDSTAPRRDGLAELRRAALAKKGGARS
jgi:sRNA-binding protein